MTIAILDIFFAFPVMVCLSKITYNVSDKETEMKNQFVSIKWIYKTIPESKLSGGQKQKLALARLFLISNKTLLLDEAFSAIDVKEKLRF